LTTFCNGIDIGGANIKVYRGETGEAEIHYFPMWLEWENLEVFLRDLDLKGKTGVVVTAELSDAFSSKEEGVKYVSSLTKKVFDEVYFIDLDGNLKKEIDNPLNFSASNWVASVKFLAEIHDSFIFADMGSTTTDIIPVKKKRVIALKTDFERLKNRELLYFGILRTPSFHLINDNCSTEFFSITADVMRILGLIDEKAYSCDTPNGRGKSVYECMQRLARQFCADRDEVGVDFLKAKAIEVKNEMVRRVSEAFMEKSRKFGIDSVVGCGIGEMILKESAERAEMEYISLRERFGELSDIFPAYAIAKLVERL